MPLLTLNGLTVIEGEVRLPRVGAWHADLRVDAQSVPTGPVMLQSEDKALSLKGAIIRGAVWQDTLAVRVIGGAGGLAKGLPSKFYRGIPLRIVLADIASESGESVSPSSDAGVLGTELETWSRIGGPAYVALAAIVESAQCVWRILPDGSTWLGQESWPSANLQYDLLSQDPALGALVVGTVSPQIVPGTTLDGRRVSYVVHRIQARELRSEVFVEQ
ncbi:MAG TPA: hypothetical protein VNO21_11115 [Polyangiaceae bacterium]|nr:hypothetical protein [Polyangiaceae bacterium]